MQEANPGIFCRGYGSLLVKPLTLGLRSKAKRIKLSTQQEYYNNIYTLMKQQCSFKKNVYCVVSIIDTSQRTFFITIRSI